MKLKLYRHRSSRDTAFTIVKRILPGSMAHVNFYNLNSLKMDMRQSILEVACGEGYIRLKPMHEYEVIEVGQ